MSSILKSVVTLAAGIALAGHALAGGSLPANENWVTSWYASPEPIWGSDFILPTNVPAQLRDQSVLETVRLSMGGKRLRLVFSNRYGQQPLVIGGVSVAAAGGNAAARYPVSFGGQTVVSIPPGAPAISDPIDVPVAPLTTLNVVSYYPKPTPVTTFHWGEQQTNYLATGNQVAGEFKSDGIVKGRLFLSAVLVEAQPNARTIVALGDSITDGNGSTPDTNRRWPDFLANRLVDHGFAVANAGISGARLLKDGMGVNALARFEQDVLSQPGVTDVVVLFGTNDIGWPGSPFAPGELPVTVQEFASTYRQLVDSAHARGVRVIGTTVTPFRDALKGTPYAGHYNPQKERLRQEVNEWIRHAGIFDAVVDFDALLRDPHQPERLLEAYDSGDHLHPGDAGYRAMAEAVGVSLLKNIHTETPNND